MPRSGEVRILSELLGQVTQTGDLMGVLVVPLMTLNDKNVRGYDPRTLRPTPNKAIL